MAHEWLRQYSQTDFASPSTLPVHKEADELAISNDTNESQTAIHTKHHDWEHRYVEGSERSYPESVDPSEEGSVQEAGTSVAPAVDDTPSAPIAVPQPTKDGQSISQAVSSAPESIDFDVPSIPNFIGERKTSIGFDPKVKVNGKHEATMAASMPKLSIRTRVRGRSMLDVMAKNQQKSRARSEADSQEYDPVTGERLDERPSSARDPHYNRNQPRWPLLQATVDELASCHRQGKQESSSMDSKATISHNQEFQASPPADSVSSPVSFPSPDWYSPQPPELPRRLSSRSKSYNTLDRAVLRRASRRSTAASSASPASAFLSRYAPSSPLPMPDDEGQEIGDYVLGREIGFGGFSVIREAMTITPKNESILRAVKVVRRHINGREESDNEALQAEFEHEVEIWRDLRHTHVLPLIAVYNTDFATFAITQLNTGGTLYDAVRKNRSGLRPWLARRYTAQLATALRYLHEDRHIVHRDLKLENCLLDMTAPDANEVGGKLLLCDFGLADYYDADSGPSVNSSRYSSQLQLAGSRAATFPQTADEATESRHDFRTPTHPPSHPFGPADTSTNFAGSLPYATPEVLDCGTGILNTAVDMWALGVLCFAIVMGNLPFNHTFAPKLRTLILHGKWDKDGLKAKEERYQVRATEDGNEDYFAMSADGDADARSKGALTGIYDLVEGCLMLDPTERWDIQDVLNCAWLRDEVDMLGVDD